MRGASTAGQSSPTPSSTFLHAQANPAQERASMQGTHLLLRPEGLIPRHCSRSRLGPRSGLKQRLLKIWGMNERRARAH